MTEPADAGSTLARHPAVDRTPPEAAPSPTPDAAPDSEHDVATASTSPAERPSPGPAEVAEGADTRDDHRTARGYSWPPFQPGNTLSLRHGVTSPRTVEPIAAELAEGLLAEPDTAYLAAPSYRPAVWAWAQAEARARLLTDYLARLGEQSGDGVGDLEDTRVTAAYRLLHRAESSAAKARSALGLDPLSRARLGRDVTAAGASLVELMSRGAKGDSPSASAARSGEGATARRAGAGG